MTARVAVSQWVLEQKSNQPPTVTKWEDIKQSFLKHSNHRYHGTLLNLDDGMKWVTHSWWSNLQCCPQNMTVPYHNEATQTHCYNPVTPSYLIWAYYAHGRQHRCQEDPVGLRSGRLEKTTGSSPHHMAQHRPTGSETSPSYAPRSSRFGSEPPSVEDDVDVWRYAIVSCMPETTTTTSVTVQCCE